MTMARRVGILLILLLPSAWFAWQYRDMPRFGYLHDDAILFGSAKSLAATGEYRIISLPEKPYQTKYPPLYPAYLSLVWKLNPRFPENLALATRFNWALLIPCLALSWALYRRHGFGEWQALALVAFMAINPSLILFGTSAMTEVFFTCGLLAVLRAMERETARAAVFAGILAGCVYLSRTAGIALLISGPSWYAWKRSWRGALAFFAGMLPFVAGWMWWARLHQLNTTEPGLLFYTDYLRFQSLNVGWDNLAPVMAVNLRELLYGMGSLVFPRVSGALWLKVAAAAAAIGMCAGVVRMARGGGMRHYALFGLVTAGILTVWHYPPNERFVLPLFPLLLAGLITEIEHIGRPALTGLRSSLAGTRVVGFALTAAIAGVVGMAVVLEGAGILRLLPSLMENERIRRDSRREAYAWMAANIPAPALVLSADDPVLYLYTGFAGNTVPLMPRDWYAGRSDAVAGMYVGIAAYCRRRRLEYFYFSPDDLGVHWDPGEDGEAMQRVLLSNPELTAIHRTNFGAIYRVRPSGE